jgi:hypothetical protein
VRFSDLALVAALAVSALPWSAVAEPTTTPEGSATAVAAGNDADHIVCRTLPAPTGSRLGAPRECHSQREWDRMRQEQQNMLSRQQIERGIDKSGG